MSLVSTEKPEMVKDESNEEMPNCFSISESCFMSFTEFIRGISLKIRVSFVFQQE